MKLKTRNTLIRNHAAPAKQLLATALEADKPRRVQTVAEIEPHGPHRRAIAQTETDRVDHVIKLIARRPAGRRDGVLTAPKTDSMQTRIDVARVVEQDTADILADQREPQFHAVDEQGPAADGKSRRRVPRSGLIDGEAAMRVRPAAEKSLR